jgi:hypothetical protein
MTNLLKKNHKPSYIANDSMCNSNSNYPHNLLTLTFDYNKKLQFNELFKPLYKLLSMNIKFNTKIY